MAEAITMNDGDAARGLQAQVRMLTEQVSRLLTEKEALSRAIVERDAAEAAAKEPAKKAPEKKA